MTFSFKNIGYIFLAIIASILFSKSVSGSKHIESKHKCTLEKVVDGDTIKAECSGKIRTVRLLGIDCPESSNNQKCRREGNCDEQIPNGIIAKNNLKELLKKEKIQIDFVSKDKYKRDLGYVYYDSNVDVGLQQLKQNLCKNVGDKYPHPKQSEYKSYGDKK